MSIIELHSIDSLANEIRKFSDSLRQWMEVALKGLPESLQEAKYKGMFYIHPLSIQCYSIQWLKVL